jgi:hypothetical protein
VDVFQTVVGVGLVAWFWWGIPDAVRDIKHGPESLYKEPWWFLKTSSSWLKHLRGRAIVTFAGAFGLAPTILLGGLDGSTDGPLVPVRIACALTFVVLMALSLFISLTGLPRFLVSQKVAEATVSDVENATPPGSM